MAGLTKKQLDQLKGLDGIDKDLLDGYEASNSTLPAGLNAAQIGGASGVGFETPEDQAIISDQVSAVTEDGGSKSQTGNAIPTLNSAQAQSLGRSMGLEGIIDPSQFSGLTYGEAASRARAEKQKRTGQLSENTSYAFNPQTLTGLKKTIDRVGLGLTDIQNSSWDSNGTKQDKTRATLEAGAKDIAGLFSSQEEMNQAMQTNPQLQQLMQSFQNYGGDVANVASKISEPVAGTEQNIQSTGDYLAGITNPMANKQAEEQALNDLIPEKAVYQEEIMRQASIPQDLVDLYFGTEQQVGIVEMKKKQAIEEKRILEEREKDANQSLRAQADTAIAKNKAEQKIQTAKVEENRLAAKNYMTGKLAKLGALKTTGAAPAALQTLETKYQNQAQQLEIQYKFATRTIENSLNDELNNIENNTDEAILKLEQDLTKDYEDITKEVNKAQQSAQKEIFRIKERYSKDLQSRTNKHTADLKKEAEAFAKQFLKTASDGLDVNALGRAVGGGSGLFTLGETEGGTLGRNSKKTALGTSYSKVKQDLKANLPNAISTKIISELTDEQMALFTDDYLDERVNKQQSFNPNTFYEEWKKANGIKQDSDEEEDFNVF